MFGSLPLMAIVVIVYNILAFTGTPLDMSLLEAKLVSGAVWSVSVSDVLLTSGLILLFLEMISATRTGSSTVINHGLSLVVFVAALVEFIVLPQFGTSTFFLITMFTLLDVVAGFTVTIATARRDFSVGE
ncbi:MAG: hypothetical protein JJ939_08840 [Alphaproteobacteria bacterium]|nr:hypothetical protein [Rhodobiaceae bacterium]MBO6542742.1 hypothetical protein [Alphaproteobacteria bacterium]MBO6628514.1 hypothetical protein [Alphaproteobacteria bacterium]MDF1626177.1 hypothetical protein [Parvibaculaceae bacterium]